MANPLDSFTERQYLTSHLPDIPVPPEFQHTQPSGKPTEPIPAGLTTAEQAEYDSWMDGLIPPTLPAAIAAKGAYEAYNSQMDAWEFADKAARLSQWRIAFSDAIIYNKPTTSVSADSTGAGSTPPGGAVAPRNDP